MDKIPYAEKFHTDDAGRAPSRSILFFAVLALSVFVGYKVGKSIFSEGVRFIADTAVIDGFDSAVSHIAEFCLPSLAVFCIIALWRSDIPSLAAVALRGIILGGGITMFDGTGYALSKLVLFAAVTLLTVIFAIYLTKSRSASARLVSCLTVSGAYVCAELSVSYFMAVL